MEKFKTNNERKKVDLRVKRTKKLLLDALLKLLGQKSFDDISVIDICNEAMVNRGTLYKHFDDKHHLLDYFLENIADELKQLTPTYLDVPSQDNLVKAFRELLVFFDSRKDTIRIIARNTNSTAVIDNYQTIVRDIIAKVLNHYALTTPGTQYEMPVDFVAAYSAGGIAAIIRWWLLNDTGCSLDDMTNYFVRICYFGATSKLNSSN